MIISDYALEIKRSGFSVYEQKKFGSLVIQKMNQDDFEVIVVDDKKNKPIDIIQEYESKIQHLRIALEEQNHSYLSILKDFGIAQARGTFIMLMDHDENSADDTFLTFYNFAGNNSDVIIGKYAGGKI